MSEPPSMTLLHKAIDAMDAEEADDGGEAFMDHLTIEDARRFRRFCIGLACGMDGFIEDEEQAE